MSAKPAKKARKLPTEPDALVEIYELVDPRDKSVRYIGKANNAAKRLASHIRDSKRRNTPVCAWIQKLRRLGLQPELKVVSRITQSAWEHEEKILIFQARLTHPRLLNVADGGNEPKCSLETRRANGKKVAETRNRTIHKLKCYFGREAKWVLKRGNTELHAKIMKALTVLENIPKDQEEAFASKILITKPWLA